jgi:hypothetical protein
MKELLDELLADGPECPVVAATWKPMDAKDFEFNGKGNFVPLWHAAKVANNRLNILVQINERLIAKNKQLRAELEELKKAAWTSKA